MIKNIILSIIGFSSGVLVAGGIFAFIAVIGVVPRLAQKTGTEKYITVYEDAITLGGIFGCTNMFVSYFIPVGDIAAAIIALAIGVFVGSLAVSLAEVIDVVPVFMRRVRLTKGLSLFLLALALGKLTGSLMNFFNPAFQ
ncbi:MAG: stage V sporulation protein AB [Firmicutes bacterium]|nr:stage V sporulation protein AB [Bacillota bacterium]